MKVKTYVFPTSQDGRGKLESMVRELLTRIKQGEVLEPEENDWLDWAEAQSLG